MLNGVLELPKHRMAARNGVQASTGLGQIIVRAAQSASEALNGFRNVACLLINDAQLHVPADAVRVVGPSNQVHEVQGPEHVANGAFGVAILRLQSTPSKSATH